MRYVILKLFSIILRSKDMIKIKEVTIILKMLSYLNIYYLRSYEREVLHYQKANTAQNKRAIRAFA